VFSCFNFDFDLYFLYSSFLKFTLAPIFRLCLSHFACWHILPFLAKEQVQCNLIAVQLRDTMITNNPRLINSSMSAGLRKLMGLLAAMWSNA